MLRDHIYPPSWKIFCLEILECVISAKQSVVKQNVAKSHRAPSISSFCQEKDSL